MARKPVKGYCYLGFTVFMIFALLIVVINDIWDPEKYIEKRTRHQMDQD